MKIRKMPCLLEQIALHIYECLISRSGQDTAFLARIAQSPSTGRRIGAATVRLLAEQGATVAFSYLQNSTSAEAVAQQARQFGTKVNFWQADAHDAEQVTTLVQRTYDLEGHLDIVVKSVPPQGDFKPFD